MNIPPKVVLFLAELRARRTKGTGGSARDVEEAREKWYGPRFVSEKDVVEDRGQPSICDVMGHHAGRALHSDS